MPALRWSTATVSLALLVGTSALVGCTAPAARPSPPSASPSASRPTPPPVDPVQHYADDRLSVMTLDEKIRSMIMAHQPGLDAEALGRYASENGLGGLILMGDNIPGSVDELRAMTGTMAGEAGLPVLVATDQEGGVVRRIPSDELPSALQLRNLPATAADSAFTQRGSLLESAGITVNFGIVADVVPDASSFLYDRSLGSTAQDAAARVAAAVAGERGEVLSTLKHFPGHGAAPGDSHSSVPQTALTLPQWRADHAPPFEAGIDAGAELVMFGRLQFDAVDPVPATLSARWHEILSDELGFDGITITDDMNMLENSGRPEYLSQGQNAVLAIAAGNTMLLYVQQVDIAAVVAAVHAAVEAGTIPMATIDDAAHALLVARRTISGETGRFVHCFDECLAVID
ncbi:beta-N-acetylhexosaminidase [Salinibacterium sp. CAN_S4]|uniref:glycoside hydrolase family 3 N-terminal domain-containing protein n=1 Tax=Salinibacterium sp. CAN_S4 TaxID=2787727 RepID=UPI0018EFDEEF